MRGSPTRATGTAIDTSRGPAVPRQCPGEQDRGRGAGTHRRVRQAGAGPAAGGRLVPVGPLPLGAPVGHGAGGLQRRRRGVVLPAARPRPLPGLPVGRGRPRGLLRRRAAAVPRPRAVERPRPDPEGADLRPDRRRGQPRRGRQGVLVVPRRAAQPRLEPVALPLPARRLPLRTADRGERPARAARPGVRAVGHRRVRRRPLLGRRRRLRQGLPVRPAHDDPGDQRRVGRRHPARAAAPLVPQHLGCCAAPGTAGGCS